MAAACIASGGSAETALQHGKYLVGAMDCGGCHTDGALLGKPDPAHYLTGADIGWAIPRLGVVYPRNITPDKATGIGDRSAEDIVKLLRTGARPDGREVAGIMNWRAYGQMTDVELQAVAADLRSISPVAHGVAGPTPMAEVKTPYSPWPSRSLAGLLHPQLPMKSRFPNGTPAWRRMS